MKSFPWKAVLPLLLGIVIALLPAPQGLTPTAWYFFAIFCAVVLGLILEPIPAAAIGFMGVFLMPPVPARFISEADMSTVKISGD